MRAPKRLVMVVDDEPVIRLLMQGEIEEMGHRAIVFSDAPEAIRYLTKKTEGIPNHKRISLIICDLSMPEGSGYDVLAARNRLDPTIPFYLLSGNATPRDTAQMAAQRLTGYLEKPLSSDAIDTFLRKTLAMFLPPPKQAILFKIGGSADDYDKETGSPALKETLDYFAALAAKGEYQIVLTVGAGKIGDLQKTLLRKYGTLSEVTQNHALMILRELALNCANMVNMMGERRAIHLTPEELCGPEFSWEKVGDRVLVMGWAPRHLTVDHPELVSKRSKNFPGIPLEDSDAHTVLLARLFGAKFIGLVKRTDGPYLFDPYRGKDDDWRLTQRKNKPLRFVSAKELLKRRLKNRQPVTRIGADGMDGHLFEDSALHIFSKSGLAGLYIAHIDPQELYPQGLHVVTGQALPKLTSRQMRERAIADIIAGKPAAGISR